MLFNEMKKVYVVLIVVAVLVVVMGLFFVFGDELLDVYYSETSPGSVTVPGGAGEGEGGGVSGTGGSGSSGVAGEDVMEGIVTLNCERQEIQYSLKNFREEVVCRESGVEGCVNLAVSCSVEVYNLGDVDGVFGIEYSVVDSVEKKLDSMLIEKSVVGSGFEIFSADFAVTENVDEGSTCGLEIKSIPIVEVCN